MTTIYFKDQNGRKVAVEVTDEVAAADTEIRREGWRNEAKERYHRGRTLDTLTDDAFEYRQDNPEQSLIVPSPEDEYITTEDAQERKKKLRTALASLTPEQLELVKMLKKGMSLTEIAAQLGIGKSAVSNMRIRIQEKIKKYLK